MSENNDFDPKKIEEENQDDENDKEEKIKQELIDFLEQIEDETGKKIDLDQIKIEKYSPKHFFLGWTLKALFDSLIVFLTLFGFTSLLGAFKIEEMLFYFIYLLIPTVGYFIFTLIALLFRKRLLFFFHGLILNIVLVVLIIVPTFFIPHLYLTSLMPVILASVIVVGAKMLINRIIIRSR